MKKYLLVASLIAIILSSCNIEPTAPPQSDSGVSKATIKVVTDLNGKTTEQNNIIARYTVDNAPGAIKHLYIISAYSGQTILYSTVKGKVTSSGKRLTPVTVATGFADTYTRGMSVEIGGTNYTTGEVLQDDGTYGSSAEYIYWFDSRGVYHQQYITGGMIVHVSSQPIAVKGIIINIESDAK